MDKITINESLPVVDLVQNTQDKRVFGVISDKDDVRTIREQQHSSFITQYNVLSDDRHLTINSLSEGAMWVCNVGRNIENGDFICSSPIPGLGMKQADYLLHNYTAGKSTCDCDFNGSKQKYIKIYEDKYVIFNDKNHRQIYFTYYYNFNGSGMNDIINNSYILEFIGCTYNCG